MVGIMEGWDEGRLGRSFVGKKFCWEEVLLRRGLVGKKVY